MINKKRPISIFFVAIFTVLSNQAAFAQDVNPDEDSDNDGLTNGEEILRYGSLIYNDDSDGDSLKDGYEVKIGTNPNRSDTDHDGVSDADELSSGTNPKLADNSLKKSFERGVFNPLNPKDAFLDFDGDGFSNRQERFLGFDFKSNTSTPPDHGLVGWWFAGHGRMLGFPVIDWRDTIYYATELGRVYAVNPRGREKWRHTIKGKIYGSVAISRATGLIYIGDDNGNLTALSLKGRLRWQTATGSEITSTPAVDMLGNVYIAADSIISSYNRQGKLSWSRVLDGRVSFRSNILISSNNKILYIGDSSGNLSAIETMSGDLLWETRLSGSLSQASPSLSRSGFIHVASADGVLHQINADGKIRWSYSYQNNSLSPQIYSSPVLADDGTIYIGVADNLKDTVDFSLMAVGQHGKAKWHYKMSGLPSTPAVGQDGTVYVASSRGLLHAVNSDGSMQWVSDQARSTYGSPTFGRDGSVYLGTDNGGLNAFVDNITVVK